MTELEQLADSLARMAAALARMPAPVREAIMLRKGFGLDHDAIAARMRIPLEQVEQLLADGAIALRKAFDGE